MGMENLIKHPALTAGLLVAGLTVGANAQAASVYAVSINQVTNFDMDFTGGSGTFNGFTLSQSIASTESGGVANIDFLDAAASCIACGYNNSFVSHSPTMDFSYGDSKIFDSNVLAGTGNASAIAEAYAAAGNGYAKGSNILSGSFTVDTSGTSADFSFLANPYLQAYVSGGVNASTVMSMVIKIAGESLQPTTLGSLNVNNTIFNGSSYLNDLASTQFNLTTGALSAGTYSIDIEMVQEVTVNAVPVPAAVWLFGSGLLGLIGVARRKR